MLIKNFWSPSCNKCRGEHLTRQFRSGIGSWNPPVCKQPGVMPLFALTRYNAPPGREGKQETAGPSYGLRSNLLQTVLGACSPLSLSQGITKTINNSIFNFIRFSPFSQKYKMDQKFVFFCVMWNCCSYI